MYSETAWPAIDNAAYCQSATDCNCISDWCRYQPKERYKTRQYTKAFLSITSTYREAGKPSYIKSSRNTSVTILGRWDTLRTLPTRYRLHGRNDCTNFWCSPTGASAAFECETSSYYYLLGFYIRYAQHTQALTGAKTDSQSSSTVIWKSNEIFWWHCDPQKIEISW